MAGTPDDWSDWYAAGGRRLTDLGSETPRIRMARLQARALEVASRLNEDALEAWLALADGFDARPPAPRRRAEVGGHAGIA
jgi:hypothetical protein